MKGDSGSGSMKQRHRHKAALPKKQMHQNAMHLLFFMGERLRISRGIIFTVSGYVKNGRDHANGLEKRTAQTLQDGGRPGRKRNRKAGKFCGCFLQNLLHTDFVRDQSQFFIKAEGTRIAGPDIQGDMVAAIFLCKSEDMLIKKLPDVLAAVLLIHADIINVECSDFGHQACILLVLKDAESMATHLVIFIDTDENGRFGIAEDFA